MSRISKNRSQSFECKIQNIIYFIADLLNRIISANPNLILNGIIIFNRTTIRGDVSLRLSSVQKIIVMTNPARHRDEMLLYFFFFSFLKNVRGFRTAL